MPASRVAFNPFRPEFSQNPYPFYDALRTEDPVHCVTGHLGNDWVLTRHADIQRVLSDSSGFIVDNLPARLRLRARQKNAESQIDAVCRMLEGWLFFVNGAEHSRLREVLAGRFTRPAIQLLCGQIERLAETLLPPVSNEPFDFVARVAQPLPALASAAVLGMPVDDADQLVKWSRDLFGVFIQPLPFAKYVELNTTVAGLRSHFASLLAARRSAPTDDLLTHLSRQVDSAALDIEDALAFCMMLFSVGQETTQFLISNSVQALLENPLKRMQLETQPGLLPQAVKELARFNTPVQLVIRIASEEVMIGGKRIAAGDRLHLFLGAANRDPEVFPNPAELDFLRKETGPIFGGGRHVCLGAHLAHMTAGIAIQKVLERLPALRLMDRAPHWVRSIHMRGLHSLHVVPEVPIDCNTRE